MVTIIIIFMVLSLVIFIYNIYHNKLLFLNIKITNVEEKIKSTLIKRKELLKDSEKIIKEIVKTDKTIYEGIDKLNNTNIDMIKLDRNLLIYMNEFHLIKDKYKVLDENEDFKNLSFKINETEDKLNAYKEYYNDIISKYNTLIRRFPIIILTVLKRRKTKEFFDKKSSSDNDYKDFKY